MNKTVNINLGGMFFHIDEDAYQKLTRYFDAIKRSLSNSNGEDEIIKDIEDVDGDMEFGCKTMPILIGIRSTKNIAMFIAFLTIICLVFVQIQFIEVEDYVSFVYFIVALQLPLAFLIYKIKIAEVKSQFRFAGNFSKFIMLMGIFYLFVFAYPILHDFLNVI